MHLSLGYNLAHEIRLVKHIGHDVVHDFHRVYDAQTEVRFKMGSPDANI